jgi:predicted metal-dependent hydrolase
MTIMMPVRRDVHPSLNPDRITNWHGRGNHVTHFLNALSLFFPAGERFFMDSVRNYRDRVTDPELKKAVMGFIGQEAMHTREHMLYNELMSKAGLPAGPLDRFVWRYLEHVRKWMPKSWQLALTIALEHYTAMLAGVLLSDEAFIKDSEQSYRQVWLWHALEETEHKAVAYDVWNTAMKPGLRKYLLRTGAMVVITLTFWPAVFVFHTSLVMRDKTCRNKLLGFGSALNYLWGKPGALRRIIPEWFDYFRPNFHPWDQDNREQLSRLGPLLAEIDASQPKGA